MRAHRRPATPMRRRTVGSEACRAATPSRRSAIGLIAHQPTYSVHISGRLRHDRATTAHTTSTDSRHPTTRSSRPGWNQPSASHPSGIRCQGAAIRVRSATPDGLTHERAQRASRKTARQHDGLTHERAQWRGELARHSAQRAIRKTASRHECLTHRRAALRRGHAWGVGDTGDVGDEVRTGGWP